MNKDQENGDKIGKPLGWKSVGKMVCESFLKGRLGPGGGGGILDKKLFRAVVGR